MASESDKLKAVYKEIENSLKNKPEFVPKIYENKCKTNIAKVVNIIKENNWNKKYNETAQRAYEKHVRAWLDQEKQAKTKIPDEILPRGQVWDVDQVFNCNDLEPTTRGCKGSGITDYNMRRMFRVRSKCTACGIKVCECPQMPKYIACNGNCINYRTKKGVQTELEPEWYEKNPDPRKNPGKLKRIPILSNIELPEIKCENCKNEINLVKQDTMNVEELYQLMECVKVERNPSITSTDISDQPEKITETEIQDTSLETNRKSKKDFAEISKTINTTSLPESEKTENNTEKQESETEKPASIFSGFKIYLILFVILLIIIAIVVSIKVAKRNN